MVARAGLDGLGFGFAVRLALFNGMAMRDFGETERWRLGQFEFQGRIMSVHRWPTDPHAPPVRAFGCGVEVLRQGL